MAMSADTDIRPLSWRGYAFSWLIMAVTMAPLWIWQDGRYGILKSMFFALFFAWVYARKRNTLDVAVFSLIMTGLHLFSRQVVNYHQLVIGAEPQELLILTGHAALTLLSAWLMSWLFDLHQTPGPTYTRLAAYYMTFYFSQFILHALPLMIWHGLPLSPYHALQFLLLLSIPLAVWWLGARMAGLASRHVPPLKAEAGWKRRFRDFENTRAVVFSCLALFAASIVWFGFVHFSIGKLGVETFYGIAAGCDAAPGLDGYLRHALWAAVGADSVCLSSAALVPRIIDYLQVIISLFLFLVLVQAVALALGAQDPERSE